MKRNLKRLLITSTLAASLAACNGSGSTSSNNNGGGGNQGDATQLTFVAPNIVPSLPTASTSYVVVNNPTNSVVTGVKYQLGNIVGGASNVTLDPASSANCATVAANGSCTFKLITQANSLAGSFSLSASNGSLPSSLSNKTKTVNKKSLAANLPTTPTIGVQQVAYTTTTGANGITLYYFNTVVAGVPMIMVTGVVNSNQAGSLNTVTLLDGSGSPLPNQQVISGNMGAGAASLGMGSTFSILLPAPTGTNASQTIGVKTEQIAANGTISNPQISSNTSTLSTASGVAIVNMLPSSIYLTESNPTQQVTFSNTGDATAQLQGLVASNPNIEVVFSSASLAPSSTVTATLRLKDTSVPAASSSITLSYNNGQSDQSQSSDVDQNVVPGPDPIPVPPPGPTPVSGLTATFANNNFNVTTAKHTTFESMTISNTGNTTENNFVVTMPNSNFSLVNNPGSANNCKVSSGAIDLSQSLESSTSCIATVKYDNTTVGSGTGNISIAYKYNNGTTAPTPATAAVNWKVSQPTANLVITGKVANPYIFPTTLRDGSGESTTYFFTIKNTGDIAATGISSVVNSTTLSGLFTANNPPPGISCGATLAVDASCQLGVQFGPIPDNTSAGTKNGDLTISYKESAGATTNSSLVQNVQGQVAGSGSAVFNTPSKGTATGFSSNTWESLTINQNATTGVITYTLTNTGADAASNFVVTLPSAPTGWESMSTTCPTATGTNLAPQKSCNVTLKPNTAESGNIASTNFTLALAWSDQDSPNGESQNMQLATPRVMIVVPQPFMFSKPSGIILNSAGTYAFILDGNKVIQCSVSGGNLSNCANSGATGFSSQLIGGITLNSAGTYAFITNYDGANSTVVQCSVSGGTLSNCANSGANGLRNPTGITLNSAGTYAFITDSTNNSVIQCSVSGGTLSNCANSGVNGLSSPLGITLNSAGTYAFITSADNNSVIQCSVSGGTLSNCANSGAVLTAPLGIALNSAGTYAFITDFLTSLVNQCSVSGGTLSNCANSGANGVRNPTGITLNPAGTYAFMINGISREVIQCSVNGGTLSNCAQTGFAP